MEELRSETVPPAEQPLPDTVPGRRFALPQLSKRTLIAIAAGVLLLAFAIVGVVVFRTIAAKNAAKEAEQAAARVAAAEAQAREMRANDEMTRLGVEIRRKHQGIIEASPSSATEKPADENAAVPDALPPAKTEKQERADKENPQAAAGVDSGAAADARVPAARGSEVTSPEAAGACSLSGKTPEDYGRALSRCLEDYARQEGRKPPTQRR